jgi:hypothetical protein
MSTSAIPEEDPKYPKMRAGLRKIPRMFPKLVLKTAAATIPPAEAVKTMTTIDCHGQAGTNNRTSR